MADMPNAGQQPRPFEEMQDATGLLWLINKGLLHPRGFALAFHFDDDHNLTGWSILGDGTEPWQFATEADDEYFAKVEAFLNSHRPQEATT